MPDLPAIRRERIRKAFERIDQAQGRIKHRRAPAKKPALMTASPCEEATAARIDAELDLADAWLIYAAAGEIVLETQMMADAARIVEMELCFV